DVLYDGVALTANGCLLVCQRHVRGHLAERIRLGLSLANDWNCQRCDDGIDSHHYVQEPPELLGGWVHQPTELGSRGIELVVIEIANMRKVWLDLSHPEPVSIVWAERGIIGLASQDRLAVGEGGGLLVQELLQIMTQLRTATIYCRSEIGRAHV